MTKFSSRLPKESDDNALGDAPVTAELLRRYQSQAYTPVVALVRTKEIVQNEEFLRVPTVELVTVEVALDDVDADQVRDLLQYLHDQRVGHLHPPMDLPDADELAGDLDAIEAGADPDVVDAELVDETTEA